MTSQEASSHGDRPHHLILEGRSRLSVSGVTAVGRFDEQEASLSTTRGLLTIHGSSIHMETLSLDSGEVTLSGQIDALDYSSEGKDGGFFSRFFR